MFEIKQKIISNFYINGLCADIDYIHVGYVEDESLAMKFCEKHTDCIYHNIPLEKRIKDLEEGLIDDDSELELITIPVKRMEL